MYYDQRTSDFTISHLWIISVQSDGVSHVADGGPVRAVLFHMNHNVMNLFTSSKMKIENKLKINNFNLANFYPFFHAG